MKSRFDLLKLGIFAGIVVPVVTFIIIYLWKAGNMPMDEYITFLANMQALPKMMSLCVIPNLGLFFLFIWREHNYAARGVLAATIVLALFILVLKLII